MKTVYKIFYLIAIAVIILMIGIWIRSKIYIIIDRGHVFCVYKEDVDSFLRGWNCTYSLQDISPKSLTQIVSEEFGTKIPTFIPDEIKDSTIIRRIENVSCKNPKHQYDLIRGFCVDESGNNILCMLGFP